VEPLSNRNLERAAQLFNKTNQMNLSTRRLAAAELLSWARADGHKLWTFRVSDKFGDYGLCGISSLACNGTDVHIVDFLMSCRIMGRGLEDAMLATVMQCARDMGCHIIRAGYIPSTRNVPCRKWLENQPGVQREANDFVFSLENAIAFPPQVRIDFREADERVSV